MPPQTDPNLPGQTPPGTDGRNATDLSKARAPGFEGEEGAQETSPEQNQQTTEEGEEESGNQNDQESFLIAQKASAFDLLAADPIAGPAVQDWIARMTGAQPQQKPNGEQKPDGNGAPKMSAREQELQNRLEALERRFVTQERSRGEQMISDFRAEHPDFDKHAKRIATLVQNHGLSIEQAYTLAKSEGTRQVAPPEGRNNQPRNGRAANGTDRVLNDAQQKIAKLPAGSGRSRLDQALEIAFDAATKAFPQGE